MGVRIFERQWDESGVGYVSFVDSSASKNNAIMRVAVMAVRHGR